MNSVRFWTVNRSYASYATNFTLYSIKLLVALGLMSRYSPDKVIVYIRLVKETRQNLHRIGLECDPAKKIGSGRKIKL